MNDRLDRALRMLGRPVVRAAMKPSVRGSSWFRAARQILEPTPQEAILDDAMAFVAGSRMAGDYLEFGVGRGTMLATAFHAARRHGLGDMRFFGFDSFEGMPEPAGPVAHLAGAQHDKGAFAATRADFERVMADNRVDRSRVEVVHGWFDHVLTDTTKASLGLELAAVVVVDSGSEGATRRALDFATSCIQDGTLLVFGDWFSYRGSTRHGQAGDLAGWLARNPGSVTVPFQRFGWHGRSFIVQTAA